MYIEVFQHKISPSPPPLPVKIISILFLSRDSYLFSEICFLIWMQMLIPFSNKDMFQRSCIVTECQKTLSLRWTFLQCLMQKTAPLPCMNENMFEGYRNVFKQKPYWRQTLNVHPQITINIHTITAPFCTLNVHLFFLKKFQAALIYETIFVR